MPKSSKTKKFIIMIVFMVLLLVVLLFIFFPGKGTASASGIKTYGVDEYLEWMGKEQLCELFENMGSENNTAYVLRYSAESGLDGRTVCTYAVYVPSAAAVRAAGLETDGFVFDRDLKLLLESKKQAGGGIFCFTHYSDEKMDFSVTLDGKRIDTKITDVGFNPIPSTEP